MRAGFQFECEKAIDGQLQELDDSRTTGRLVVVGGIVLVEIKAVPQAHRRFTNGKCFRI